MYADLLSRIARDGPIGAIYGARPANNKALPISYLLSALTQTAGLSRTVLFFSPRHSLDGSLL